MIRLLPITSMVLFLLAQLSHGQINQPTFLSTEVGTVVFRWTNDTGGPASVSLQPAIADFQHGLLYIGGGRDSIAGSTPYITWWNMSNPRSPVLVQANTLASGNKPHVVTFWGNKFAPGHQGLSEIWDYTTRTAINSYNTGGATGVWRTLQPPYEFNHTNGYGTTPPQLDVASINMTTDVRTSIRRMDLSQLVGFYIGASHAVGNLLIVSAGQARGVAVIDISNPADPRVLSTTTGTGTLGIYTSQVHGSRLYTGEHDRIGVYNFANPRQIVHEGDVTLPAGSDGRYIGMKEGKGYIIPGSTSLHVFDTATRTITNSYTGLPAAGDFTYPVGNMIISAGQSGRNLCAVIPYQTAPDTQGPKVDFSSPADRSVQQAATSRIGLIMSDQISVASLSTSTFIVRPLGSTTALTGTYSTQMGSVNFSPTTPLAANTIYEVILPVGGVKDAVGNGLREEFRMRFSTGPSVDDTNLNLVSRYPLDETTGTTANDVISTRNGALTAFPATPWVSGYIGGGLAFDGADDFVNVGTFDTGNRFTVAGWVKIAPGFNNLNTIFGNSTSGFSAAGFKLFVYGSTNATAGRIQLETGSGTAGDAATTSSGVFQFGQWNHVAVTVDKTAGRAAIYYNGVNVTSDATIRMDFTTNLVQHIGQMTNNTNRLRGELDDLHVYDRALYASEIEVLRTQREGPIGHWRANNAATDDSGGGRTLTLNNGAAYSTTAMEGSHGLVLDGVDDSATVTAVDLGQSFTFSSWVRVTSGNAGLHTIAANSGAGSTTAGFRLFVYGSTHAEAGRIRLETANGTASDHAFTNTGAFSFNAWNHVTCIVDRAAGTAEIYVNGVDVAVDRTVRTDFANNLALSFGRMGTANSLGGGLDDLRLYSRLLVLDEVRVLSIRSPLAHWAMDNNTTDQSGFNRALTLTGGPGFSTSRARGTHSLNLDGADDRGDTASFDLGNTITLSAWVNIPSNSSALETIIGNSPGGFSAAGFKLFVYGATQASAGRIQLETGDGVAGNAANTITGTFLFGQWNHIAVTIDRAAGTARIYHNRRDVTSDFSIMNNFSTAGIVSVGAMSNGNNTLQGQLDDVRIYGAIATAGQINALGSGSPNVAPVVNSITSTVPKQTVGTSVTFTAGATDTNVGEFLTYSFDFGDGTSSDWSSSASAAHSYAAPGRYVVTAFVDDGYTISTRTFVQIVHRPVTAIAPTKSTQVAYDTVTNKVWIVNPDIDTVSRLDAVTRVRDFEQPVGIRPSSVAIRPGASEVWVTCRDTGDIRVLNSSTGAPITTILLGRGYAPMGLAFAPNGSAAFVACEGAEGVVKINPSTRAILGSLALDAPVRALAVSGDSTRLFVARFLSPDNQGQVWEINPTTLALVPTTNPNRQNPYTLGIDTTPDSPNGGRGLPNYLMDAALSPDGRRLWIPGKKDNFQRGTGPGKTGGALTQDNTVRSILCQVDVLGNAEVSLVRKDVDDQGLPAAVCFSPVGDLVFAAFIANNEVLAFDAATGNQVAGIVVGSAPSGLVLKPDGTRLYVHNFLSRTVTTIDVTNLVNATSSTMSSLGDTNLITTEKLAANVLTGKRIFYNANDIRMSAEGYMSCASCHLDGDHDARTWDFTDRGEGFRNNITLLGRSGMGHGRVHWSGNFDEIQDFELDIRNAFGGSGFISGAVNSSLGAANGGRSADLDAMAAYVSSLNTIPKSPYRNADGSMTTSATAGAAHFTSKGCAVCHSGTQFTDSSTNALHNIGTINTASGKRLNATLTGIDTPTLRGIWSTAPYLHRGQAIDLPAVFNTTNAPGTTNHARFRELTTTQQTELINYLLELE